MRITKIGHSCMVVEEGGAKILIDPGGYSTGQSEVRGMDAVLITHEHPDHLDASSLRGVLANNPGAKIFTNRGVGTILSKENIPYVLLLDGQSVTVKDVPIEGVGEKHAVIYPTVPVCDNVGYFIGGRFFYPGDRLTDLKRPVEILALPIAAPWMRLAEAIDYALALNPKVCFPVHDGMLKHLGSVHALPETVLTKAGISFKIIHDGGSIEI